MSSIAALAFAEEVADAPQVTIRSELLGDLTVAADSVFDFPVGLFGFPECRQFVLVPAGRDGFFWLQSLEYATLAFLLADPFQFFPGYAVELSAGDRADLRVATAAEVAILCVVTLPQTRTELPTANLQGPIALNFSARLGRQLALSESEWGVRCHLEPTAAAL